MGEHEWTDEAEPTLPTAARPAQATEQAPSVRVIELQREIGNRAVQRVLDRQAVNMPPAAITGTEPSVERGVPGLDQLRGVGVDPAGMSISHDAETIRRNSPVGEQPLPFRGPDAWDAQAILTTLGQYDADVATDSDALRCVQAALLASRVVRGPLAVEAMLSSAVLEGMLATTMGARQRTAIAVLRHVKDRIAARHATFADLSWVQEALHDLFYDDASGTPLADILQRVATVLDVTFTVEGRSSWLDAPEDVIAVATALGEGEQLLLNTWEVAYNQAFEELDERKILVPVGKSQEVNVGGRTVTLTRIDASRKPPHTAIRPDRDQMSGHQLLIIKDAAVGGLRLYEPEVTDSGRHLEALTVDLLRPYFRDLPDIQIYSYMEILGKLTPTGL